MAAIEAETAGTARPTWLNGNRINDHPNFYRKTGSDTSEGRSAFPNVMRQREPRWCGKSKGLRVLWLQGGVVPHRGRSAPGSRAYWLRCLHLGHTGRLVFRSGLAQAEFLHRSPGDGRDLRCRGKALQGSGGIDRQASTQSSFCILHVHSGNHR